MLNSKNEAPSEVMASLLSMAVVSCKIAASYKLYLILLCVVVQSIVLGSGENSIKLDLVERITTTLTGILIIFPVAMTIFPITVTFVRFARLPIILWVPITVVATISIDYGTGATYWFIDREAHDLNYVDLLKNTVFHNIFVFVLVHFFHRDLIFTGLKEGSVNGHALRVHDLQPLSGRKHDQILKRLPREKWGEVLELYADKGLTRVRTANGQYSIRLPLKTAVAETDVSPGLLIHRSIWINQSELSETFFENGNPKVRLRDGSIRPVGRAQWKAIQDAFTLPM